MRHLFEYHNPDEPIHLCLNSNRSRCPRARNAARLRKRVIKDSLRQAVRRNQTMRLLASRKSPALIHHCCFSELVLDNVASWVAEVRTNENYTSLLMAPTREHGLPLARRSC
jgi:hypothetical protein